MTAAMRMWEKIKQISGHSFSGRDIKQKMKKYPAQTRDEALNVLEEYNYVRRLPQDTSDKPGPKIKIH